MAIVVGVWSTVLESALSQQTGARFVKSGFVGEAFFLGLVPETHQWLTVEVSTNLVTWTALAHLSTTNHVTEFVDTEVAREPKRFYRLRQPGMTLAEAEAIWLQGAIDGYQFHIQHVRSYARPAVLDAVVTVRAGKKQVSDVLADGERPIETVDSSELPMISELFERLKQAQAPGCWRVAVIYDSIRGYPSWCVMERLTDDLVNGKHIDIYRATGFSVTEAGF